MHPRFPRHFLYVTTWVALLSPPATAEPIRFVFTGHINPLVNSDRMFELADLIAAETPRFVIVGGDVIVGPDRHESFQPSILEEQWAKFDLFVKRVGCPVHLIPGNHDISSAKAELRAEVGDAFPRRWADSRLLDLDKSRFILLNTVNQRTGELGISPENLDFIRNAVADAGDRRLLIFTHQWTWESHEWPTRVRPLLGGEADRWWFAGDHSHAARGLDGNVRLFGCGCGPDALNYLVVDIDDRSVKVTLKTSNHEDYQPIALTPMSWQTHAVDFCRYNLKLFGLGAAVIGWVVGVTLGILVSRRCQAHRATGRTSRLQPTDPPLEPATG